jgi:glycosyltransferase involved in cell wall biosynthesis
MNLGPRRIGFVSTRFAGTDGVSLEAAKWAAVLERLGHEVVWFAGELDRPAERSHLAPLAFYRHPEIAAITREVFEVQPERGPGPGATEGAIPWRPHHSPLVRSPSLTRRIRELAAHLHDELAAFCRGFAVDALVVENAWAIPLNLPLGLALTDLVAETGIPVIAHHHDLPWERQRFALNTAEDLIAAAFPPRLPSIRHVVINSVQAQQLAWRTGLVARVIPNVMDFGTPPPAPDVHASGARAGLGVGPDEALVLQPTRVVARKGIEHAIELVRRLGRPAALVISHAAGDEGTAYETRVREFAELLGVHVRFESDLVTPERMVLPDGRRTWTLDDIYPHADLVTYGSSIEGFGNAFLEAVYHRRPIVVNRYSIYEVDIAPRGFRAVEFDGFISEDTVRDARRLLDDPALVADWGDTNHALALRHFSFGVLERRLDALLAECLGDER